MNGRNPTPWTAPRTLTFRRSKFIACTDFGGEPLAAPRALLLRTPSYVAKAPAFASVTRHRGKGRSLRLHQTGAGESNAPPGFLFHPRCFSRINIDFSANLFNRP